MGKALQSRTSVRALLIGPADDVLLLHSWVAPGHWVWVTPGGGIEPGESASMALARELQEETGYTGSVDGPWVWTRSHRYIADGIPVEQRELFRWLRCERFDATTSNMPHASERAGVASIAWWSVREINASTERFAPRRIGSLLQPLLAGEIPDPPIDVGL